MNFQQANDIINKMMLNLEILPYDPNLILGAVLYNADEQEVNEIMSLGRDEKISLAIKLVHTANKDTETKRLFVSSIMTMPGLKHVFYHICASSSAVYKEPPRYPMSLDTKTRLEDLLIRISDMQLPSKPRPGPVQGTIRKMVDDIRHKRIRENMVRVPTLSETDILNLRIVCRSFNGFILENANIWQEMLHSEFTSLSFINTANILLFLKECLIQNPAIMVLNIRALSKLGGKIHRMQLRDSLLVVHYSKVAVELSIRMPCAKVKPLYPELCIKGIKIKDVFTPLSTSPFTDLQKAVLKMKLRVKEIMLCEMCGENSRKHIVRIYETTEQKFYVPAKVCDRCKLAKDTYPYGDISFFNDTRDQMKCSEKGFADIFTDQGLSNLAMCEVLTTPNLLELILLSPPIAENKVAVARMMQTHSVFDTMLPNQNNIWFPVLPSKKVLKLAQSLDTVFIRPYSVAQFLNTFKNMTSDFEIEPSYIDDFGPDSILFKFSDNITLIFWETKKVSLVFEETTKIAYNITNLLFEPRWRQAFTIYDLAEAAILSN